MVFGILNGVAPSKCEQLRMTDCLKLLEKNIAP
jgi:hypothetical protein